MNGTAIATLEQEQDGPEVDIRERLYEDLAIVLADLESGEQTAFGFAALERVVLASMPVVKAQAKKFYHVWNLENEDFQQAGVEGIYDAIARARSDKVEGFYSYVGFRIFDYMFRHSAEIGGAVTVPEGALKRAIVVRKMLRRQQDGEDLGEMLEVAGMTRQYFDRSFAIHRVLGALSFEHVVREREAMMISEEYYDGRDLCIKDPADLFEVAVGKTIIKQAIDILKPREQFIVRSYFGLDGFEQLTLAKIGEALGVTESRICQIMAKCKNQLAGTISRLSED